MRYPDWAKRLDAFLRDNATREFQLGEWDCCMFSASAIWAMTGNNPMPEAFDGYRTYLAAHALLTDKGDGTVLGTVRMAMARSGYEEIPILLASRGDLVAFPEGDVFDHRIGIVGLNGRTVVGPCGAEVMIAAIKDSAVAWRIK